jgi:MOSC domain-containing protein YiiM
VSLGPLSIVRGMRIESVNLGAAEDIRVGRRTVSTGIRKRPVDRARMHALGLEGDTVSDSENHGGPDQAVYLYSREDYTWWEAELARPLPPGSFGENVTLDSLGGYQVRIGDRYRLGEATVEVTSPRIPCGVFAAHTGESRWVKRFRDAERPGLYCRVIEEGEVAANDSVERIPAPGDNPTAVEYFRAYYESSLAGAKIEWLLAAPVDERGRRELEEKLARLAG